MMTKARLLFATAALMAAPALMLAPALLAQDAPPAPPTGQQGPPPPATGQHHWQGQGGPQGPGQHMQGSGQKMGPGQEMRAHGMHGHDGMMGGTWWRNADLVAKVGLSPEQVKHIDEIFMQSRMKLIDEHASLEKEQLKLEPLMNANPVDQKTALAEISKIADERAELEKTNAGMLLSIRGVLTADQWTKLQADHGRGMHDMHGKGGPAEMDRGPRGGRGPGMAPPPSDGDEL